jgi:NAD(P)-dependent dehydrogenase (short-subunit alcohol dehydrogenase family)
MTQSLQGRRILVTGGATGIGAAAVQVLSEAGAAVVATYHRTPPEEQDRVSWVQCDVRDSTTVAPHTGHYVAAKHGVVGLMRSFAVELGPQSIRVNSVHPTHVNTPLLINETTFRLFPPDLENPGPGDLAPVCQTFHTLPIPWVTPERHQQRRAVPGIRRIPLHHRRRPSGRRGQLPEVTPDERTTAP